MKEKIELYQEVLELEPGSKVFFPLARLLSQAGQAGEAVAVLRQGLERHPEFTEARLMLIQLLRDQGRGDECSREMSRIVGTFAAYPSFWDAWSEFGAQDDQATALGFLAASFRNPDLSLQQVLLHGLNALKEGSLVSFETGVQPHSPAADQPEQVSGLAPLAARVQAALGDDLPLKAESLPAPAVQPLLAHEETDEPWTLHTRSMAEVLTEQGDIQGALDIYEELLDQTASDEEEADLRHRINSLNKQLDPRRSLAKREAQPENPAGGGQNKLVSLLDKLAQRLETRAQR